MESFLDPMANAVRLTSEETRNENIFAWRRKEGEGEKRECLNNIHWAAFSLSARRATHEILKSVLKLAGCCDDDGKLGNPITRAARTHSIISKHSIGWIIITWEMKLRKKSKKGNSFSVSRCADENVGINFLWLHRLPRMVFVREEKLQYFSEEDNIFSRRMSSGLISQ